MNTKAIFTFLALSLILTGCHTMKVTTDRDPNYDFNSVRTYFWMPDHPEAIQDSNPELIKYIQTAANGEFTVLGLKQVFSPKKAAIQVACRVVLREEEMSAAAGDPDTGNFTGGLGYTRGENGWGLDEVAPDLNTYSVEFAVLTVTAYDSTTGNRVWESSLETQTDRSMPEEHRRERIRTAAQKIMQHYPLAR